MLQVVNQTIEYSAGKRRAFLYCLCDCGDAARIRKDHLGVIKSCGCLRRDAGELRRHRLSTTWEKMIERCTNPNHEAWEHYGGRGIKVCPAWIKSPAAFYAWAEANGSAAGLQLNRIDNDGDYEPDNCNFVTSKENNRNKSGERYPVTGRLVCLKEALELCDSRVPYSTVWGRLKRGIPFAEAVHA